MPPNAEIQSFWQHDKGCYEPANAYPRKSSGITSIEDDTAMAPSASTMDFLNVVVPRSRRKISAISVPGADHRSH